MTSWEINAITFSTIDMGAAVSFWRTLGLDVVYGGPGSDFSTLGFGSNFVNLQVDADYVPHHWGRVVFHVDSPDELWRTFTEAGYRALTEPADAPWGERYFHIRDPDGHELSFARPLQSDGTL